MGVDDGIPRLNHALVSVADGRVVLKLEGELDMATADELRAAVDEMIDDATQVLVLDVEQLRFADSSAIALWVSWCKRVPRVEVHKPRPMVRRVIEAMGLTDRLNPS